MTESKAKSQTPAEMPKVSPYRLTREDYPRLQQARKIVGMEKLRLEKLKTVEYTNDQGLQDMRITYKLHDNVFTAENLTEWGHAIALQIANKIENWTPDLSVYQLAELRSTMRFCDPACEADLTKLQSARIDKKLKGLVTLVDNAGFGVNLKGDVINIDETLTSIEAAERLGMKFVKE
jgi:hypothetical protein